MKGTVNERYTVVRTKGKGLTRYEPFPSMEEIGISYRTHGDKPQKE